jgi:hypothetical protein
LGKDILRCNKNQFNVSPLHGRSTGEFNCTCNMDGNGNDRGTRHITFREHLDYFFDVILRVAILGKDDSLEYAAVRANLAEEFGGKHAPFAEVGSASAARYGPLPAAKTTN